MKKIINDLTLTWENAPGTNIFLQSPINKMTKKKKTTHVQSSHHIPLATSVESPLWPAQGHTYVQISLRYSV